MGEVRRAHDRRLDRDVAIKFLRPGLAAQPHIRDRFESEARNAAQLTHPNVVTVLDSGEIDGQPYMVMECLPGRTLKDALVDGPLGEQQAKAVARDILSALAAAHELGIVHRDVTPANILLTDDGRAKIADFGIAKSLEAGSQTLVGQVLGTPSYLAPERVRGEPATPSADVYALGVVLYEALSATKPFRRDSAVASARAVLSTMPAPLHDLRPDIDPAFAAAIDRAMAKDPAARPASAAAMRAEIEHERDVTQTVPVMTTRTVAAVPVHAPVPWWERVAATPKQVWFTIAAVVAVGLLLLALTDTNPHANDVVATDQTAPITVPTTIVPTTTTLAPIVQVRTPTKPAPKPKTQKAPKGKHGH